LSSSFFTNYGTLLKIDAVLNPDDPIATSPYGDNYYGAATARYGYVGYGGYVGGLNEVPLSDETASLPNTAGSNRELRFDQNNPIKGGNLGQLLDSPGDFTFLAPTNNAFRDIPQDLLSLLFLDDEFIYHLEDLLLYHGLTRERFTGTFRNNERIASFNSENILFQKNPLRINNGITFARTNIETRNGVAHAIRGVLKPNWVDNSILSFVSDMSDLSLLLEFLILGDLDQVLNVFGDRCTLAGPTNAAFQALGDGTLMSLRDPKTSGISDPNTQISRCSQSHHLESIVWWWQPRVTQR
jgi:uncharacterized surface protein with fasciclin (FAS1) repeats